MKAEIMYKRPLFIFLIFLSSLYFLLSPPLLAANSQKLIDEIFEPFFDVQRTSTPLFDPETFDALHPKALRENSFFIDLRKVRQKFLKELAEDRKKTVQEILTDKSLSTQDRQLKLFEFTEEEKETVRKFNQKQSEAIKKHTAVNENEDKVISVLKKVAKELKELVPLPDEGSDKEIKISDKDPLMLKLSKHQQQFSRDQQVRREEHRKKLTKMRLKGTSSEKVIEDVRHFTESEKEKTLKFREEQQRLIAKEKEKAK